MFAFNITFIIRPGDLTIFPQNKKQQADISTSVYHYIVNLTRLSVNQIKTKQSHPLGNFALPIVTHK